MMSLENLALTIMVLAAMAALVCVVLLVRESRPPERFYRDAHGNFQWSWWYPSNWWIWGFLGKGVPEGVLGGAGFVVIQWLGDYFVDHRATSPALLERLPAFSHYGGMFLVVLGVLTLVASLRRSLVASPPTVTSAILWPHLAFGITSAALLAALWGLGGGSLEAHRPYVGGFLALYSFAGGNSLRGVIHVARQRGSLISANAAWIIVAWAIAAVALMWAVEELLIGIGFRMSLAAVEFLLIVAFLAGGYVGVQRSYPEEPKPEAPEKEPFELPRYARVGLLKLLGGGLAWFIGGFTAANAPPGVFYPWMVVLAIAGIFFTIVGISELFGGTWKAFFNPAPTLPNRGQKGRANFGNKRDLLRMGALANDD
jgi:hypothetical protein